MRRTVWLAVAMGVLAMAVGPVIAEEAKPPPQANPAEVEKAKAAMPEKAPARPVKARKLFIFTGAKGFYHDSIPLGAEAIKLLGETTGAWESVISNDPSLFKADSLKEFDGIFLDNTTGDLFKDEDSKAALLDFAKGGKGVAGNHGATDCFYNWKDYGEMIGGYFTGHPFGRISVQLDDPKSPINAAFEGKGFRISDEIYVFRDPYSRQKLRILLSIDWEKFKPLLEQDQARRIESLKKRLEDPKLSPEDQKKVQKELEDAPKYFERLPRPKDCDYALSWIHEYGKGRVFYTAFGHDHAIFWNKPILQHFLAGIQYALGDLKADATPSAAIRPPIEPAPGPDLVEKKAAATAVPVTRSAAAEEKKPGGAGWTLLFDGKDLSNWMNAEGKEPGAGWVIDDGALVRKSGAGDIWTKERFGDFVLDLEFKTEGNSGIFIRTDNPKDNVQTGIEIQIEKTGGKQALGKHDCGAVYDCLAPTKNTVRDNDWNHIVITTKDNLITIVMNGEKTVEMDLNQWSEAKKNPDGSPNKFNNALKDFKREGHIGLQDHGARVMYRNIKVKPLGEAKKA